MLDNLLEVLKQGKNKIIYKINDTSITYYECYQKVLELSNNLKIQGNSSVIVYGHKSINQFISILACIVAKRCYIPIDLETPLKRILEIINKTKTTLIIKNEDINIDNIECLNVDEINLKYKDKNKEYIQNNDDAYIIFTSGSTGNAKGVPIKRTNLNHFINFVTNLEEFKNLKDLNILSQASFSFDLSVMDIYFSIYKNFTIIALENNKIENINKIYEVIKNNNINFLIMTPTLGKILLLDNDFSYLNFPDLKYMFFCGECLEVKTVKKIKERFKNIKVINAYGPTEATCFVTLLEITDNMLDKDILPVGLIDTAALKVAIENDEIILKGNSVFEGYLDINSASCFKENNQNCFKTKDRGYIKDNYLYVIGRLDSQIKYQGYRIELKDIENNLLKIKGIKDAIVLAKFEKNIVKMIKAFVLTEFPVLEKDLKYELSKLIPQYMIPKKIVILDSFPVNKNGKVDRKKLEDL